MMDNDAASDGSCSDYDYELSDLAEEIDGLHQDCKSEDCYVTATAQLQVNLVIVKNNAVAKVLALVVKFFLLKLPVLV